MIHRRIYHESLAGAARWRENLILVVPLDDSLL